jgi:ribonuclease BN (tRNA processing enzyme)
MGDRMDETFRVILLGTGSPRPSLARHHPAALVEWGERGHMLVDAGDGVVSQLLAAGVALETVHNVALTHMHWDHILGYPAFVWGSWSAGRQRLAVTGPAGTAAMHDQLVERYYRDQAEWAIGLGYPRAGFDDVEVRDVAEGWSETVDGCLVEAGPVHHPPMDALAFRFTWRGRSLVISGDTARCDAFVAFARGADVMVVDACAAMPPGDIPPARRRIFQRLHEFHASPQDCVDMAAAAGAGKVVLTHHLPGAVPAFDASGYAGDAVVGADLDVIDV